MNDKLERNKYQVVFAISYSVKATDGDEAIDKATALFEAEVAENEKHTASQILELFGANAEREG